MTGWLPSCGSASSSAWLGSGSVRSFVSMWATSMRKPSTPRSDQNRSVRTKSSRTSGLSQLRSGCSTAKKCRYHWPSRDPLPRRAAEERLPVGRRLRAVRAAPVAEDVALARGAIRPARRAPPGTTRAGSTCGSGTMSTTTRMPARVQRRDHARRSRRACRAAGRRRGSRRRRSRRRRAPTDRTGSARPRRRRARRGSRTRERDAAGGRRCRRRRRRRSCADRSGRRRPGATSRRRRRVAMRLRLSP